MDYCCKVDRLSSEYGLQHGVDGVDFDQHLLKRWLGQSDYAATGLRPLTESFNQKLLKTVYNEHGRNALESRVSADYEALTVDDPSLALLDDLETDGIDGQQLRQDFLSTTTLYRHFTDCLDASKSSGETTASRDSNWETEKVDYARNVFEQSIAESLRSLANKGEIPQADTATIKTEVILGCPECATQVSFRRAHSRGYICTEHMGTVDADDETTN